MTVGEGDIPELVIAEVGYVPANERLLSAAPNPALSPAQKPPAERPVGFPRGPAALAAAILLLCCVALVGLTAYRGRTVTRTERVVAAGSHGADAAGCPYGHTCDVVSVTSTEIAAAFESSVGYPAAGGSRTVDQGTGQSYAADVIGAIPQIGTVVVRARCVPGSSVPADEEVTNTVVSPGVEQAHGVRGYLNHGCSVVVVVDLLPAFLEQNSDLAVDYANRIVDRLLNDVAFELIR